MSDDQQNDDVVTMDRLTLLKCRYIVSEIDGANTLYCGKSVHKIPYCKEHYQICYRKSKTTRGHKKARFEHRDRF